MGKGAPNLETTLAKILIDAERGQFPEHHGLSITVPEDLREEGFVTVCFSSGEAATVDQAIEILVNDLRFEYLKDHEAKDLVHRFAIRAFTHQQQSVAEFVDEHAREPERVDCFLNIEHLAVTTEVEIAGVRFVSPGDAPQPTLFGKPVDVQGVAAVSCVGTNFTKMTERAREKAEVGLRVLRAALRNDNFITENQLRFKLGEHAWFSSTQAGWARHPDDPFGLELNSDLVEFALEQPYASLPAAPSNDVERRAHRALLWLDKAQLEMDPTTRVLFGFFALESILGDKSEGEKARSLAYRRAMLGATVSGHFTPPDRTFFLYDSVRSEAVHGEGEQLVTGKEARGFVWDVRLAIGEYITFSKQQALTKRKVIRRALDEHPDRAKMAELLTTENPKRWADFFIPKDN